MTFQIISANANCIPMIFICCLLNLKIFLEHLLCASDQDRDAVWWEKIKFTGQQSKTISSVIM